jgi:transcriptional regulator with XRE-family HTH domain
VPRKKKTASKTAEETFGQRLARLRTAAGFTQRDLAMLLGISHRRVAYYELQEEHPFTRLIPALAEALGVSGDELLGIEPEPMRPRQGNQRLWRRFRMIEQLPPKERKQLLGLVDTFLERDRLTRDRAS